MNESSPAITPWFQVWTKQDLIKWQSEDPAIEKILAWNQQGSEPQIERESPEVKTYWTMWSILKVKDEVLYKHGTFKGTLL